MSRSSPQMAQLSGRALVRLKDGREYVGHVRYDGKVVTIKGRLRVVSMVGGENVVSYRLAGTKTVPMHLVREIEWDTPSD